MAKKKRVVKTLKRRQAPAPAPVKPKRTKHVKKEVIVKSTRRKHEGYLPAPELTNMPPYAKGSVVFKENTHHHILIADVIPTYLCPQNNVVVMSMETGKTQRINMKDLWVLGYSIVDTVPPDKIKSLVDSAGGRVKTVKGKDRSRIDRCEPNPKFCEMGKRHNVKDCEIVEGEDPYKSGVQVHIEKGHLVAGLKVLCPTCGKKIRVRHFKAVHAYYTVRHPAKKAKEEKETKAKRTKRTTEKPKAKRTKRPVVVKAKRTVKKSKRTR